MVNQLHLPVGLDISIGARIRRSYCPQLRAGSQRHLFERHRLAREGAAGMSYLIHLPTASH
jgi:hypothetical protein